jgi:translocation and assembly module TamB
MPVDDRDERPLEPSSEIIDQETHAALESESDAPLPPRAEAIAERDADRPEPLTPQGQRRRYLTRRNAMIATLALAGLILLLIFGGVIGYKLGYVDRYVAHQIVETLSEYGIHAEIKEFHTKISPRTVEMQGVELYDAKSGERLGTIGRMLATVRIEDLYALSLRRNIDLESLVIDNLELWVNFDAQGRSNFRNLSLPAPDPNQRILFSYSTAHVELNNAIVHYGDESHNLSGEARNIVATIEPEDLSQPQESRMNRVTFKTSGSTFVYDNRPITDIAVDARGRVNQTRVEIDELVLRSPIAETRLQGVMDDWRALRYHLQITSKVDLTQASDLLHVGATLRGVGNFTGMVTGEGAHYQADGQITSDALAANNIRLKALNVTARGIGDGANYDINGRALAELLNIGDFQLNTVQLAGGVMGTGTDFRFLGDLRAAATRYSDTTRIVGLILSDVMAEKKGDEISANAKRASASNLKLANASVSGAQASDIRVRSANNVTTASVANVRANALTAQGARANGLTASGINLSDRDGVTNVVADNLRVASLSAAGTQTGSINIAGVRLAIHSGRIEGSSGDIGVGTVTLATNQTTPGGHIENVKLARPVFTVEPSGRYRASADLSLGGGVLGEVKLGAAHAVLTASNNQIQLNNFTADIFNGRAKGSATFSTVRNGASRVAAEFNDVDVSGLIALLAGRVVPVAANATGTVDLTFPGTNFSAASGNLRASFNGETKAEANARTPLAGDLALRAERGLFQIERAHLRTGQSELNASGQFALANGDSNLQLNLASNDASELQRVLLASGLLPGVEEQLKTYNVELGGHLAFNGTIRGRLTEPSVNGRATLDSLIVNGRDLGALTASLDSTPNALRVSEGRLTQRDGGGITFTLEAPFTGTNNIALAAKLDRVSAGNLIAALPVSDNLRAQLGDTESNVSGQINVTGLPGAMAGQADLRFNAGRLAGQPFESIVARATFAGSEVKLENLDARLEAGRITASGTYNTASQMIDLQARGANIQLDRLSLLAPNANNAVPQLSGTADIQFSARGSLAGKDFSDLQITIDGEGRDVAINGRPTGRLSLVGRTENRQFNLTLTTGLLGQPQTLTARVDLSNNRLPTVIETNLANADLTPLFAALLPAGTNVHVTGHATGSLRASGNLFSANAKGQDEFSIAGLQGTANFTDLVIQVEDIALTATSPLVVQFSPNEIVFEKTQFTGPGTNIVFGGTAALSALGRQNLTVNGKLNLRVLNSFTQNNFLSGLADIAVRVSGTYEQPRINGMATVAGASYSTLIGDERLTLANVKASVRFNSNQAQLDSLTGTLGGGRVAASGGALLEGFVPSRFRISVSANDVTVPFPENFRSTADANLEINGSMRQQIISGAVNLRRAEYTQDIEIADLINRRREASLTEGGGGGSSFATTTQLDLRVEGRDALVVRNNLADLVGSASLRITGAVEDPVISGRITVSRGTLTFRNDRYELTRAYIDLPAQRDADPLLNIQAESEIRGYNVIVSLTGPLSQPNAVVRSDPALPQADVVSLITTGDLSSGSTGVSTLAQSGLGTAASLLTDTLINAPARRATDKLFGLNRFEIDPLIAGRGGASPTARLTLGRQINRNLSVTYSTNVTSDQNQVLALEYRVSNRLSFIAQYEQGSVTSLASRNNNFSFEIRFRKRF